MTILIAPSTESCKVSRNQLTASEVQLLITVRYTQLSAARFEGLWD
ncbi:hypothetical protein [Myxosarcina sp. GI1(2024)]